MRASLAYFGWRLVVDEEAFLDEALPELERRLSAGQPFDRAVRAATINRYSLLWYAACRANGTARQERAFVELHNYAYRLALRLTDHDEYLANESAQEALIEAWRRLESLRDPGAFTKWIMLIVRSKVYRQLRKGMRGALDETTGETTWQAREVTEAGRPAELSDAQEGARDRLSLTEEMRARLIAIIHKCLRSRRQREAVIGFFLEGKEHAEIAAQLGIDPQRLYVIKHRALARLRQCDEFMNLIEDLL
jgi:RNA polymerase sigma factor (sigma-70 family)